MTRIVCKPGVRFPAFTPDTIWMLNCIQSVINDDSLRAEQILPSEVVITSANDSEHKVNSKHYENRALDLRSKNFSKANKQLFIELLLAKLNGHSKSPGAFIILFEFEGQDNEHFHIQTKRGVLFLS